MIDNLLAGARPPGYANQPGYAQRRCRGHRARPRRLGRRDRAGGEDVRIGLPADRVGGVVSLAGALPHDRLSARRRDLGRDPFRRIARLVALSSVFSSSEAPLLRCAPVSPLFRPRVCVRPPADDGAWRAPRHEASPPAGHLAVPFQRGPEAAASPSPLSQGRRPSLGRGSCPACSLAQCDCPSGTPPCEAAMVARLGAVVGTVVGTKRS